MKKFTMKIPLNLAFLACICCTYFLSGCWATDAHNDHGGQCIGKHRTPLNEKRWPVSLVPFDPFDITDLVTTPESTVLENNGRTLVITMNYSDNVPTISEGVLQSAGTFRLQQMHFHWLEKSIPAYGYRNVKLPAELHFLFYNVKYGSLQEAGTKVNGLVALTFGLKIDTAANSNFDEIIGGLAKIRQDHTKTSLREEQLQPLMTFLGQDIANYWSYHGSWIAYKCVLDVIWIDFMFPIVIRPKFAQELIRLQASNKRPLHEQFIKLEEPTGLVLRPLRDGADDGQMSSIPFVDAYDDDGFSTGYIPTGVLFKNVGLFLFICVVKFVL